MGYNLQAINIGKFALYNMRLVPLAVLYKVNGIKGTTRAKQKVSLQVYFLLPSMS